MIATATTWSVVQNWRLHRTEAHYQRLVAQHLTAGATREQVSSFLMQHNIRADAPDRSELADSAGYTLAFNAPEHYSELFTTCYVSLAFHFSDINVLDRWVIGTYCIGM